jgi:CRP-like cAMP-binding protein
VVAETPLTTIRIERAQFRRMLREEPDIALKLLESMASRMRGMIPPADRLGCRRRGGAGGSRPSGRDDIRHEDLSALRRRSGRRRSVRPLWGD